MRGAQDQALTQPSQAHLVETRLSGTEILRGGFIHAFRDTVRLPDGATTYREYMTHPGAVMIIPLLTGADGTVRVVMERQFRYPIGQVMVEFPAGKRDAQEPFQWCAQRELQEETGYTAAQWAHAGALHPAIAYSTERIDIWFARDLTAGAPSLDPGEFLEVFDASPEELLQWCRDGRVTDAKTLAGALWLRMVLDGTAALQWLPALDTLPHAETEPAG